MGVWLPTCFNIKFVFNKRKKLVFEGLYLFIYETHIIYAGCLLVHYRGVEERLKLPVRVLCVSLGRNETISPPTN